MTATAHDLTHLLALVDAAKQEADRIGAPATVGEGLDRVVADLRALVARDGEADEGIRPADLTTDNDK